MGNILLSFFEMLLYCAIIIFVAFIVVWALCTIFGIAIDGDVLKWGKVVVGLLCFIAFLAWVLGVLGLGGGRRPFRLSLDDRTYSVVDHYAPRHLHRMSV